MELDWADTHMPVLVGAVEPARGKFVALGLEDRVDRAGFGFEEKKRELILLAN